MAEADIFDPDDRVELIDGEVVEMSPMGTPHGAVVARLTELFVLAVHGRAIVRPQLPMQVGDFSELEPDIAVIHYRANYYSDHHPMPPDDVLLVIEVAESSLRYDLDRKTPLYIAGGVPEVWVVDLVTDTLHVARGGKTVQLRPGDSVAPAAFPDLVLEVADILGPVG